jgi:hypothetical protein
MSLSPAVRPRWCALAALLAAAVAISTLAVPAAGAALGPGRVCPAVSTRHYTCFVELDRRAAGAGRRATTPAGWGAADLEAAYGIDPNATQPTTIAVIDAFGYPHAEADLNVYRKQYGLPPCTTANGCFEKLNQRGRQGGYPTPDAGWGIETAMDLQMVSAACPSCHVILVEADNDGRALDRAEQTAVDAGATVTSHSYGIEESRGVHRDAKLYRHPGVTVVASTGDSGYGAPNFPASARKVVAVGGTVLSRSDDARGWKETAWSDASSGCSTFFGKPVGQPDSDCPGRSVADISAVARHLAIYDTSLPDGQRGWLTASGTSASAPFVAGMIAASGARAVRPANLYALDPSDLHDILTGSNGRCHGSLLCTAGPGWDGPTGLGTPTSPDIFVRTPTPAGP